MDDLVPLDKLPPVDDIVPADKLPDTLFGRAKKAVTNLAVSTARNAAPLAFAVAPLLPESTKQSLSDFYDQSGDFIGQNQPTAPRGFGDRVVDTVSTIAPLVGMGPVGATAIINNALTGTATEETLKNKPVSDIIGKTALKTAGAGATLMLPVGGVLKTGAGAAGAIGVVNAERVLENNLESDPAQQRAFNVTDDILMPVATQLGFGTVAHLQQARGANKIIDSVAGKLEKGQYVPDSAILQAKNAASVYIRPAKELAALQRIKGAEVSSDNVLNEKMGAHVVDDIVPTSDLPHSDTLPPATDATVVRPEVKPVIADSETGSPLVTGPQRVAPPEIQTTGVTYDPKAPPPAPSQMQQQGLHPDALRQMYPEWSKQNGLISGFPPRVDTPQPVEPAKVFNHDDLTAAAVTPQDSLSAVSPVKPAIVGTKEQIMELHRNGDGHGKAMFFYGDEGFLIDPQAAMAHTGIDSPVKAVKFVQTAIMEGGAAKSKALGYPDRTGVDPAELQTAAVTKSGEVVTDPAVIKTEATTGNVAWAAEGKPAEVQAKAADVAAGVKPNPWQSIHAAMTAPENNVSTKVKGINGPATDSAFTKIFSQQFPSLFTGGNNPQALYTKSDIQATVKKLAADKGSWQFTPTQHEITQHLVADVNNLQEMANGRDGTTTPPILFHAGLHVPQALATIRNLPGIKQVVDSVITLAHPETWMAEESKNAFFKLKGERNQANDLLAQKLDKASQADNWKQAAGNFISAEKNIKNHFDRQTPEQHLAFYDKVRTGDAGSMSPQEAKLYAIGTQLDGMFASRVRELFPDFPLRDNHAMFTLKWDQDAAESAFPGVSARLEGDKGFTKKYSGNLASDLAGNGLTLRESNPVKVLQKSWNDHIKFLSTQIMMKEAIESGRAIYETRGNLPPKDYTAIPDAIAKVTKRIMFPEEVKSQEYIDKSVYEGLLGIAQQLGIRSVTRPTNMGGRQLGDYSLGFDAVRTKANTETSVLAHEIGHAIDQRNDLWSRIVTEAVAEGARGKVTKTASTAARVTIKNELRAIADIMVGGRGAGKSYTHKRVEQIAQMVEAYVHAPEAMKETAPAVFKAFDEYVKSTPSLAGLDKIAPGIQLTALQHNIKVPKPVYAKSFNVVDGEGNVLAKYPQKEMAERALEATAGADKIKVDIGIPTSIQAGTWYLPKTEALVLGRYLKSDPLHTNPVLSGLIEIKGIDTSMELLGLFHFANIGNEGIRSKLANVMRGGTADDANVRSTWGMKKLAEQSNSGELANNPESVAELQRAGLTPEQFKGYVDGFYRGGGKLENVNRDMGGPIAESWNKLTARVPALKTFNVAHDAVFAITDQLFHKFVPDLKLSAYIAAIKTSERVYADRLASGEVTKEQLERDTVKHIENVFGELNYENLMLPKALKSSLQLVFRAPGWNIGTWRAIPDAFRQGIKEVNRSITKGEKPILPMETAWLLSTVTMHVLEATIIGYAAAKLTGDDSLKPKTWVDYFFPKMSLLTRVTPPGYLKDVFSMGMEMQKAPFFLPLNFLQGKLAGIWGRTAEVIRNKNYYGTQVRDENDNPARQALDIVKHMAPKPIFVKSITEQSSKGDTSPGVAAAAIIGYPKAPAWVDKSKLAVYLDQHTPRMDTVITAEETDHKRAVLSLANKVKVLQSSGKSLDAVIAQARELIQSGKMTEKDLKAVDKLLTRNPLVDKFQRLGASDAIKAFNDLADDGERGQVLEAYNRKMDRLFEDNPALAEKLKPRLMDSVEHIRRIKSLPQ